MRSKSLYIIILIVLGSIVKNANAQANLQDKISIDVHELPVTQVLSIIEQEYNYYFAYNPIYLPKGNISLSRENTPIKQILNEVLDYKFTYSLVGNHIILSPKVQEEVVDTYTISGTISNIENIPIDSVIIYAVKDQKAVITDKNGHYSISLKKQPQYINISHPYFSDTLILTETLNKGITIRLQYKRKPITDDIELTKLETKLPELQHNETNFENNELVKRLVSQEAIYVANNLSIRKHSPAQLSFIPWFSSNAKHKGLQTNILSLNILAGYSGGLCGLEVGGLANIIHNDVIGMQVGGLTNIVNGNTNGAQFGGILNYNFGYLNGIQIGGIGNISRNATRGIQAGGIFNINKGDIAGFQIGGITNINSGSVKGAQLAGIYNFSPSASGVQIAGILNTTKGNIKGAQLAGISNYASATKGVQISSIMNISSGDVTGVQISGIINKAKGLNGLQLGIVNIADSVENGLQFGLLNIVKNGYRAFEFTTNETYAFDFLYKTGGKKLYSIINVAVDKNEFGAGYGLGLVQPMSTKLSVSVDALATAMLFTTDTENMFKGQKSSIRVALNYDFYKHIGVTTGVSFNFFDPYRENEKSISANGLPFYSNSNDLISQSIQTNHNIAWVGWFVGIRL